VLAVPTGPAREQANRPEAWTLGIIAYSRETHPMPIFDAGYQCAVKLTERAGTPSCHWVLTQNPAAITRHHMCRSARSPATVWDSRRELVERVSIATPALRLVNDMVFYCSDGLCWCRMIDGRGELPRRAASTDRSPRQSGSSRQGNMSWFFHAAYLYKSRREVQRAFQQSASFEYMPIAFLLPFLRTQPNTLIRALILQVMHV